MTLPPAMLYLGQVATSVEMAQVVTKRQSQPQPHPQPLMLILPPTPARTTILTPASNLNPKEGGQV